MQKGSLEVVTCSLDNDQSQYVLFVREQLINDRWRVSPWCLEITRQLPLNVLGWSKQKKIKQNREQEDWIRLLVWSGFHVRTMILSGNEGGESVSDYDMSRIE